MNKVRLTKRFTYETAHVLYGYDGLCRNVHGHSYKLYVTVLGTPLSDHSHVKNGMVIDFSDLKKIVKEEIVDVFDHGIVLNKNTPHAQLGAAIEQYSDRVHLVNYQPTCENMVVDFAQRIRKRLPDSVSLFSIKLFETETSYAEWFASDNDTN